MCGIIGYIGSKPVVPVLLDGLRRMEYRGYDSAGVAVVSPEGISLRRSAGKLANLENTIRIEPVDGLYGVGHTRWATHGRPTEENAHPHRDCTGRILVRMGVAVIGFAVGRPAGVADPRRALQPRTVERLA